MVFYGSYQASENLKNGPVIDFIEFEFEKADAPFIPDDLSDCPEDIILSCDWVQSDWDYDSETGAGCFRCKGVFVNQRFANGHLDMFKKAKIDSLQVWCEEDTDFELTGLSIADGDEELFIIPKEQFTPREIVFEG